MKKILILSMALMLFGQVFALTYGADYYKKHRSSVLSGSTSSDPFYLALSEIETLIAAANNGTGTIFYVDSNVSTEGAGTSWTTAKDTLDEAINLCSANNGDVILVAAGHAESFSAAAGFDADIAGITIIGIGNGSNAPTFTFADTDATVAVGAAGVKLYNLRFLAGISEVVTGISIEAAGDDCSIVACQFPEPTTSTFEFDEAITAASGADRLLVKDCVAFSADATGASSFIDLTAGVNNGTTIIGNIIHGEYSNAPIYSDKADLETYIAGNMITNLTASQFAIEFTAAATGVCAHNTLNTTSGFEIDPGSMVYYGNNQGTTLPEGVSVYDVTGGFSGDGGAAQDDSIKASLDLAHTDLDAVLADTAEMQPLQEQCVSKVLTGITSGNNDLFVIAGGPVKIIEIVGYVTTEIEAKSCLINYNLDPTAPATDTVFGTDGTALEINADAVGTLYTWDGVVANDLTATSNGVALGLAAYSGLVVPAGSLELAAVVATSATGEITFYIRYIPLSTSSVVTAAP